MKPIWLIYHVPKTGGQTLRDFLSRHVGVDNGFIRLGRIRSSDNDFPTVEDVAALSQDERDALFAVSGHPVDHRLHDVFANRRIREVVILRHPAERIVSHYNFFVTRPHRAGSPVMPFDEWYESRHRADLTVDWLAKRLGTSHDPGAVAARLATCTVVGRTPNLSRLLPPLLSAMGLEPVTPPPTNVTGTHHPRVLTLDGQLRERLTRDNPGDTMLYHMVRPLERQSLRRLGTSLEQGA